MNVIETITDHSLLATPSNKAGGHSAGHSSWHEGSTHFPETKLATVAGVGVDAGVRDTTMVRKEIEKNCAGTCQAPQVMVY